MKLYNKKRQEAAEAKDDEKVKEYMDKVQNLMQMSKDMIEEMHNIYGRNSSLQTYNSFATYKAKLKE